MVCEAQKYSRLYLLFCGAAAFSVVAASTAQHRMRSYGLVHESLPKMTATCTYKHVRLKAPDTVRPDCGNSGSMRQGRVVRNG
jgi:hypothetical protein